MLVGDMNFYVEGLCFFWKIVFGIECEICLFGILFIKQVLNCGEYFNFGVKLCVGVQIEYIMFVIDVGVGCVGCVFFYMNLFYLGGKMFICLLVQLGILQLFRCGIDKIV